MTNGGHPPQKPARDTGKKGKGIKPRRSKAGNKQSGKLEALMQTRA